MRRLTLISHLRRRSFQLQEEWLKAAGIVHLLEQGYTRRGVTTSVLPEQTFPELETELDMRRREVTGLREHIDELEEAIQQLGTQEGKPSDPVVFVTQSSQEPQEVDHAQ